MGGDFLAALLGDQTISVFAGVVPAVLFTIPGRSLPQISAPLPQSLDFHSRKAQSPREQASLPFQLMAKANSQSTSLSRVSLAVGMGRRTCRS